VGIGVNNIGDMKLPISFTDLLITMHKSYQNKVEFINIL